MPMMTKRGRDAMHAMADEQTRLEGMLVIVEEARIHGLEIHTFAEKILGQVALCNGFREEARDILQGEHHSFWEKFEPVDQRFAKFMDDVIKRF